MGSRKSILASAVLFLGSIAAVADERAVTTHPDRDRTVKIQTSGDVVMDCIYRGPGLTAYTQSFSNPTGTGAAATSDGENTVEGHVSLRLDIEMTDKVAAVVEIGTKRVDGASINELGNATAEIIQLRELHVLLNELFSPNLSAQLGVTTWSFDVRGRGNSFAFDPRHSQSFFRNLSFISDNASLADFADDRTLLAGFPEELDPVGGWARWVRGSLSVDLVLLPAGIEGGSPSDDEAIYAADFFYKIGEESRIGAILAIVTIGADAASGAVGPYYSGTGTSIFTLGGGADLQGLVRGLELYGEAYFQFGDAGKFDEGGALTAPAEQDIDAGGMAFQFGGEYRHLVGNPMPLRFGANFTYISGDDDETDDDTVERFLSYENVNDLMILEDMYFGYDVDSNYSAIKLNAGLAFSVAGGKDNLDLEAIIGFAEQVEDSVFGPPPSEEGSLGTEFDLKAKWQVDKQLVLKAAFALLTGSDLLEQSMESVDPADAEDSVMLLTMGFDLTY